jgi:hypothetical protein
MEWYEVDGGGGGRNQNKAAGAETLRTRLGFPHLMEMLILIRHLHGSCVSLSVNRSLYNNKSFCVYLFLLFLTQLDPRTQHSIESNSLVAIRLQ